MKWVLIAAALLGAFSVIIGAFLKHIGGSENIEALQTALKYHQIYSVVLLVLGLYCLSKTYSWKLVLAPALFLSGITVFSGSLYIMGIFDLPALGSLTPVGGVLLITGWLSLFFLLCKN